MVRSHRPEPGRADHVTRRGVIRGVGGWGGVGEWVTSSVLLPRKATAVGGAAGLTGETYAVAGDSSGQS